MLASIVVATFCLITLQVVLVVKVADWMSRDTGRDSGTAEGRNDVVVSSVNGRFAGIA